MTEFDIKPSGTHVSYFDRMERRYGLKPHRGSAYENIAWLLDKRSTMDHQEAMRCHGGGFADHVYGWRRDGAKYLTFEPYGVEQKGTAWLANYLATLLYGCPGLVADVYRDGAEWHPAATLIVFRRVDSEPLPGRITMRITGERIPSDIAEHYGRLYELGPDGAWWNVAPMPERMPWAPRVRSLTAAEADASKGPTP